MSRLKLVYQYNNDGNTNEEFVCDFASLNGLSITECIAGNFQTVSIDGETLIEITFFDVERVLNPKDEVEIQFRVVNNEWNSYNLLNDFSYNGTSYSVNANIQIYYDGELF